MTDRMATIDDLRIDSPTPRTARRRRRWPQLGILAAIGLLAGAAWRLQGYLDPRVPAVEIYTIPAGGRSGGGGFTAGGYLEVVPPGPLAVAAMVEGRVQSVEVVEGQTVQADQVLARVDDTLYRQEVGVREAAVALARAKLTRLEAGFRPEEIAQAKADVERAQARLRRAQLDYDRNADLVKEKIVSKVAFDASAEELTAAKADVSSRRAELDLRAQGYRKEDISIARAEVGAAEAELERSRWKVSACAIKAPVAGVVLERFTQPGDWIAPTSSPSSQRERPNAVVSLIDPKRIQAWVDVNQRDSGRVLVGQTALLATDAEPGRPIRGRVSRILPKANLQKNTVRVNVEIPEVPADLRPEMSVKVTFAANDGGLMSSPGVVVPASAVLRQGSRAVVYVHTGGHVRVQEVETVGETGGRVTLLSGVVPGDQVVVNPQGLSDGQAVQVER